MTSKSSPFEALGAAIQSGDVDAAARLLASEPELQTRLDGELPGGAFGATPLLTAVHRGNREMVDILLRAGADINARSHWWAGSFGVLDHDGELIGFLIERGARIDVHSATRLGMLEKLDELVSADQTLVHARGGDGQTPLHFAPSISIADYLLGRGADIDATDVDHESTPAQWMIRDRTEVARHLVTRGCRTDILLASALGDPHLVTQHLDDDPSSLRMAVTEEYFPKRDPRSGGCIYNWTLGTGKTAHIVARDFGHDHVFRLLTDRSPDELKLAVSCALGESDTVAALIGHDPSLAGRLGESDLRKLPDAARDNNSAAVALMLSAGWPVDSRGQHGGTALHWAAWNGNPGMTRELLRHQPSLDVRDTDHNATPIFWAVYGSVHGWHCRTGEYAAVVAVLLDAGAQPPEMNDDLEASEAVRRVLRRD
ncbi:MAG: ankyrin repeat domain-containing protein [Acidobacteria bacterium]|nr:ankyrin repeat domain-containing protein [Acidobacteriota bacterium]